MKKALSMILILCTLLGIFQVAALAADSAAAQNDLGAYYPSDFLEYKGYYYTLWDVNCAVARHKADGTENKVLFSYGGHDDLNTLRKDDYYKPDNVKDQFVNMLIYQDKIYVSVAKNNYVGGSNSKQYSAIYTMNLDGTGWTELIKTSPEKTVGSGSGPKTKNWCIWNDRIYVEYEVLVNSYDLTGGDKKTVSWTAYSDKNDATGAGDVACFYGDEAFLNMKSRSYTTAGQAKETEFRLYKINLLTRAVTQYKTLNFKASVKFVADGWVYITNNKNEWWRVIADGSLDSGEYIGKNISDLTAFAGDLYFIDSTNKTAYKSDGLGPVKKSLALTKTGVAKDLIIAGDYIVVNDDLGRTVTDLTGSTETFSLAYRDDTNYLDSSLVNKGTGYVYRPTFRGAANAGQIKDPASILDTYFAGGVIKDGWYNLRLLYKYINIDANGNAELRYNTPTTAYYVEKQGDYKYTLKSREGKYLALAGEVKNGARVVASDTPFVWRMDFTSTALNQFTMAPADNTKYLVNASEDKYTDGTALIVWDKTSGDEGGVWRNYCMELHPLDASGKECPTYAVKMSNWARPYLTFIEEGPYAGFGDDYTQPINRIQMAHAIIAMTSDLSTQSTKNMPGAIPESSVPKFTDTADYAAWYLAYWGITSGVGDNKFDPNGTVTREQMSTFLVRTMNYYNSTVYAYRHPSLTKGSLSQFKDAGKISSWARDSVNLMVGSGYMQGSDGGVNPGGPCTIEQALVLCERIKDAYKRADSPGTLEELETSNGKGRYDDGSFIIKSYLGGYVTINAEGKGVINKTQSQTFTRKWVSEGIYTLQTADGKYLGIAGLPEDGKQLTTQTAPYHWYISGAQGDGSGNTTVRPLTDETQYFLNVSGFSKADGAAVIVYTSKTSTPDPKGLSLFWSEDNEIFKFARVK